VKIRISDCELLIDSLFNPKFAIRNPQSLNA